MYQVKRNGRALMGGIKFPTFDEARNALRRYIRRMIRQGKAAREDFNGSGNHFFDHVSRQPVNYTSMGFSIRQV